MDTYGFHMWVSPFRYLWIISYLHLPTAFRSLSRLSSALSAKASTLRSLQLDQMLLKEATAHSVVPFGWFLFLYFISMLLDILGCLVISRFCKLLIL